MLFSVIYTIEVPPDTPVAHAYPPDWKKNGWDLTECHFSEIDERENKTVQERYKHRKLCALLTRAQFDEFVEHIGMYAEDVETLGSLGAPGFGIGWAPAISFHHDQYGYMAFFADAYVTPVPEVERKDGPTLNDWNLVRGAVIRMYGLRRIK